MSFDYEFGSDASGDAIRNTILQRMAQDCARGELLSQDEYQALFPNDQAIVNEEFEAVCGGVERAVGVPRRVAHYSVLEELGRGGQGVVYRARDDRLGRVVALKVLHGRWSANEQALARFEREARAASGLDHPGICAVYDSGVSDGLPYIAMRYVPGDSLDELIVRRRTSRDGPQGRVEIERLVRTFVGVARALHYAHGAGVLHRDIKPANVRVTSEGDPVLVDFGLASARDEDEAGLTMTGDLLGTPAYMAPEQLRGASTDVTTDTYALGVTLFECLTLSRPFHAPTRDGLFQQILSGEHAKPRELNPMIGRDLALILVTAIEGSQERRYSTAAAMADDLERFLNIEPVHARPVSVGVRVARFCRRNPLAAFVIASVCVALIVISLLFDDARQALEDAQVGRTSQREAEVDSLLERGYQKGFGVDPKRAREYFDAALELEPGNRAALAGRLLIEFPDSATVFATLERALEAAPELEDDPSVSYLRAMANGLDGETGAGSSAELGEASDDLLAFLEGHRVVRNFAPPLEEARLAEAAEWFRRAILRSPRPRFHYWHSLMMAAHRLGDRAVLIECEQAMRYHWTDSPAALEAIAQFFFEVDPPKAVAAMRRILEVEPSAVAWTGLSQWHLSEGRSDDAVRCLDEAVDLDPDSSTAWFMRSMTLRSLGRAEEAEADMARAVELAPELAPYAQSALPGSPPE